MLSKCDAWTNEEGTSEFYFPNLILQVGASKGPIMFSLTLDVT